MTKLEQCLRVVFAMDERGRIEMSFSKSPEEASLNVIVGFGAAAFDGDDGQIASGQGDTPEEAICALHKELAEFVTRMRGATTAYEPETK